MKYQKYLSFCHQLYLTMTVILTSPNYYRQRFLQQLKASLRLRRHRDHSWTVVSTITEQSPLGRYLRREASRRLCIPRKVLDISHMLMSSAIILTVKHPQRTHCQMPRERQLA